MIWAFDDRAGLARIESLADVVAHRDDRVGSVVLDLLPAHVAHRRQRHGGGAERRRDRHGVARVQARTALGLDADEPSGRNIETVLGLLDRLDVQSGQLGGRLLERRIGRELGHRDHGAGARSEPPARSACGDREREHHDHRPPAARVSAPGLHPQPFGVAARRDLRGGDRTRSGQHARGARRIHRWGQERGLAVDVVVGIARGRRRGMPAGRQGSDPEVVLDLAQSLEHGLRVGGALVRCALGRPQYELVELLGHGGILEARPRHLLGRVLIRDLHRLFALVRLLAREHLVQHDAQRVDVGARVGGALRDELGREVGDGAEQLLARGRVRARRARESEVADLDAPVLGQQHVLGLHIAVDEARSVRRGEPRENGMHHRDGLVDRQALGVIEQIAQRRARKVLHDEVGDVAVLALVEDADDVRVAQPGRGAGLLDEPRLEPVVVAQVVVHHLEGDAPLQPQIGRKVHRRHSAARDSAAHPVSAIDEPPHERVGDRTRGHP